MKRPIHSLLAGAALATALGACHQSQKANGHGTVSGEILPGSVSDAMLPYDSVKSKAPLAPVQAIETTNRRSSEDAVDSADTGIPDSAVPDTAASPGLAASPTVN